MSRVYSNNRSSNPQTKFHCRGGSRIFSRGGGGFSKKIRKFWRPFFFLGRPNWFLELSQSTFLPPFWLNFLCRRQIFEKKNSQKSRFWALFEKFWQKNCVFLARAPPQSFRKILGSVGQKWISEKVSKGGPFGSAGLRPPPPPPPPRPFPKSAPVSLHTFEIKRIVSTCCS